MNSILVKCNLPVVIIFYDKNSPKLCQDISCNHPYVSCGSLKNCPYYYSLVFSFVVGRSYPPKGPLLMIRAPIFNRKPYNPKPLKPNS